MLSDLVGIDEYLDEVSFDDMGEPLKPFEQLMGCLPPSSAHLLPEPYRWLMTESSSPLNEFYPRTFTVDMNGKRWPWEAVVLLPFMDSKRLTNAARNLVDEDLLTEEERKRNLNGHAWVVSCEDGSAESKFVPLKLTNWDFQPEETAVLKPKLLTGVQHPSPGFPTLRSAPIRSLWRRNVGINVFGIRSRYRTALLVLGEVLPTIPPLEMLGKKLIGTTVYVNYPYLMEGFVTAISDSESTMRGVGKNSIRQWDANESLFFQQKSSSVKKNHAFGEKVTGSGGWMIPDHDTILTVRPLKGVTTLPDGSKARVFAKFEIDVPLTAAIWAPSYEDWRLSSIPALMEKDPFSVVVDKEKSKGSVPASSDTLLLPEYDESDSISNLASTGPVLPQLPESDPYSPQLILPAFEEQDPPVMHPLHDKDMAAMEKVTESTKEPRFKGSTLLPPKKPTSGLKGSSTKESSSSLLPPTDDFVAIASRGIATSSCSFRRPNQPSGRRSFSTGRSASIRVRSGSTRTRLFALGTAVATAIFFGGSYAQALHEPVLVSCGGSISLASKWQTIRGGGDHAQLFEENDGNKSLIDDATPPLLEFAHGTTTLSFLFEGGVVAAVDSRASLGNFVGSKTTQKVLPISSHMLGTMAGGAADCMFWIRKIKAEAHFHELSEGHRMTVARASKLLANALYQNQALNLSVGTMIMGFDEKNGPQIYYVDNTGARINGELFAVGSGSTFAYAILDTERRKDMTEEEAIALGIKAIRHATFRDAFSGGFINVYVINKDGWRKVFSEDLANIMTEDMSASNRMQ
jgi:20S proteasome subunit beta 5